MSYQALAAALTLENQGLSIEVVHVPTIKPLDEKTIIASARKTGIVITVEEAQAAGGFGSAVAEALSAHYPVPVKRLGIQDRFGESGKPDELLDYFGLNAPHIAQAVRDFIRFKKMSV
jgi:transketolase